MFFRDEGRGEPVLLVHGLGASSRVFDEVFEARPPGCRLMAVDLPRSGRSGHWAPSRPEDIADGLVDALAARGLTSAHLFGHSFGGLVCLCLATRHPTAVRSLTVAATPALGLPPELRMALEHPLADFSYAMMGHTPAARAMLWWYLSFIWGRPATLTSAQVKVYEEAQAADGVGEGVLEALRSIGRFSLDGEALKTARYPKRVLWGDRDPLVAAGAGERVARAIGAEFELSEGVGHCLPDERPELIVALVRACVPPALDQAPGQAPEEGLDEAA